MACQDLVKEWVYWMANLTAQEEEEIGGFLRTFTIPDDYQKRLHVYVSNERQIEVDGTEQRNKLEAHLGRLKDLYLLGDITRANYLAQREQVKRDLAVLGAQDSGQTIRLRASLNCF